jgi:NAD(P)-dependent dehydrogenase (short-subunit alcohol dehydrogenase family)
VGATIVTGAASGIGWEITRRLAATGRSVAAWDLTAPTCDVPGRVSWQAVDVADPTMVADAASAVAAAGPVCALVTCAAVFEAVPFLELDDETFARTVSVNLTGTFVCLQAVVPHLRDNGGGSVVLFSSMAARAGAPSGAHYAATKGGILGLARTAAIELAEENIRVNTVSPGITDTRQPRGNMSQEQLYARAAAIPLGRIGSPADMADAALFLLSGEASYVTGQDLRLDGGSRPF